MAGENNNTDGSGEVVERESRYMECRRNHAIAVGGHAVDGCREFSPKGPAGTEEALLCEACGCHRSFHRHELPPPPENVNGEIDFEHKAVPVKRAKRT